MNLEPRARANEAVQTRYKQNSSEARLSESPASLQDSVPSNVSERGEINTEASELQHYSSSSINNEDSSSSTTTGRMAINCSSMKEFLDGTQNDPEFTTLSFDRQNQYQNNIASYYHNQHHQQQQQQHNHPNNHDPPHLENDQPHNNLHSNQQQQQPSNNQLDFEEVKHVDLFGVRIVALTINGKERLCLAQISNTLLKDFSYNEIHNRRVALGITCVQCTPVQLEMLRRAGAMPSSSRRCGMITMREAERLCRSFLVEEQPPELPENFYFTVAHRVNYGCKGRFIPARYISSRAKCIECFYCGEFYSPNKFIFHSHKQPDRNDCNPPDSPNINSWRKHIDLDWTQEHSQEIKYAWEDVKSLFNGGTRRRAPNPASGSGSASQPAEGRLASVGASKKSDDDLLIDVEYDESSSRKGLNHEPIEDGEAEATTTVTTAINMIPPQRSSSADWLLRSKKFGSSKPTNHHHQLQTNSSGKSNSRQQQKSSNQQQHLGTTKRLASSHGSSISKRFAANQADKTHPPKSSFDGQLAMTTSRLLATSNSPNSRDTNQFGTNSNMIDHLMAGGGLPGHGTGHLDSLLHDEQASKQLSAPELNVLSSTSSVPTPNASSSNFIYNQLYTQLMQPPAHNQQLHQQSTQLRPQFTTLDAQLALRQHFWSSILVDLQNKAAAAAAVASTNPSNTPRPMTQQQQQLPYGLQQQLDPANIISNGQCNSKFGGSRPNEPDLAAATGFGLNLLPPQVYQSQTLAPTSVGSFNNDGK